MAANITASMTEEAEVSGTVPDHAEPSELLLPAHLPSDLEVGTNSSDPTTRDDDSAIGSSIASGTTSLQSSIYEYIEENGRTYHSYNSGKYMLPNDEAEQERLDLQHAQFKLMLDGKLHIAPISNSHRVLDLGTGTGIWAIEFAQEYPEAIVTGTDLSPIQPSYVPTNCHFEVEDAENEWAFPEPFDYIHARAVVTCFKDNRAILQKIYDNLAPGGYFELQDPSFPIRSDDGTLEASALGKWSSLLVDAMALIGRDITDSKNWSTGMASMGFTDIQERLFYVPVNPWPKGAKNKLLGRMSLQNLSEGIASMSTAAFTRVLGWEKERLDRFLVDVRRDLEDREVHAYTVVYFVSGRKPGG